MLARAGRGESILLHVAFGEEKDGAGREEKAAQEKEKRCAPVGGPRARKKGGQDVTNLAARNGGGKRKGRRIYSRREVRPNVDGEKGEGFGKR